MTVGLASLCLAALAYVTWDVVRLRASLQAGRRGVAESIASRWEARPDASFVGGAWHQDAALDSGTLMARLLGPQGEELARWEAAPRRSDTPSRRWVDRWLPVVRRTASWAGETLGTVEVTATPEELVAALRLHGWLFLILAGCSTLITLGLARRIHHRFSDQLLDLAHAANAISTRRDYSIRAVRRSDDEIGILVDTFNHMISQIELRDRQLKDQVQRAEAARVAKSQFLATMSHEIRTPINGVLGMTQLLLDTPLSDEQQEFATTIHRSADSLLAIINDILDFSKGEAGRYEIEAIPCSLAKIVHECLDTVSIVAAEKKLELCLALDEEVPPTILGDPTRLRQVLLNLLSNALKFTHKGEIVLRVQVEERQGSHVRLRFEVQDTGIGIPQNRVDRLFQSFSQVDASRSRKYGGTGLGLAISKQIIEAMGGTMFVRTQEGVGSTFGFRIQPEVAVQAAESTRMAGPHGLRILVADPSPTSGAALVKLLSEENTVELAHDGPMARMLVMESAGKKRLFDLVLADLRLVSAFESLEVIGAKDLSRAPMVILAPVNQLAQAGATKWSGGSVALAKPVKSADLFWCIAEVRRGPLPAATPTKSTAEPGEGFPSGLRVLVAEDHPVNQRITTRFLDKLGVSSVVASNGEEALAAFKKGGFDLILMDVQMPVMDGLEATLAIRKLEGLSGGHVPILALTANVLEEHRKEAQQAGFDDYLPKPVNLEDLRAKVRRWTRASEASVGAPD
jgi:signal transduction histidine kinase/CheY-like chemotaxis protein